MIKQFQFTAWPDFGVPLNAIPLLGFLHHLRQHHPYGDNHPLLIHCRYTFVMNHYYCMLSHIINTLRSVPTALDH